MNNRIPKIYMQEITSMSMTHPSQVFQPTSSFNQSNLMYRVNTINTTSHNSSPIIQPNRQILVENPQYVLSTATQDPGLPSQHVCTSRDDINLMPNDTKPYKTNLLVCMDSNQKYINRRLFWKLNGTRWKPCPLSSM